MALRTNFGLGSAGVPSNLYSGGAVTFNPQPYINYYTNQKLRAEAREDAMYRYFGDMGKSLSPAGMDAKDIPGLMKRKNEWQAFDMQNRHSIARPGIDEGKSYTESMSRYNDMMDYINRSKSKVKNLSSLKPILDSPQKSALLNDAIQTRIHHGSLPLDHPEYQEFDPTSISYNPPAFDTKQANAMRVTMSQYKPTEGQPNITPIGNNQQQVVHNFKFNDNQLNGIYTQAAVQYHNNPSFQNMIDAEDSPEAYHSMNQQFKEHYGRDINSKEDMSAAYLLSLHPDLGNKVEIRNIPVSPWESAAATLNRQKEYHDYTEAEKAQKTEQTENEAEKFLSGREQEAKAGGAFPYTHAENGKKENAYNVKLAPDQIKKIFGTRDISGKHILVPDKVQVLENGDYLPVYYQYKDGKPVGEGNNYAVDQRYTKPVSRESVKASVIANKITPKVTTTTVTTPGIHETHKTTKTTFGSGGLN